MTERDRLNRTADLNRRVDNAGGDIATLLARVAEVERERDQAQALAWRRSDEVVAALDNMVPLKARVASLEAAGEAFLGQIGYGRKVHRGRGEEVVHEVYGVAVQAFRLALAPRSEPTPSHAGAPGRCSADDTPHAKNPICDDWSPAAPKEEAK